MDISGYSVSILLNILYNFNNDYTAVIGTGPAPGTEAFCQVSNGYHPSARYPLYTGHSASILCNMIYNFKINLTLVIGTGPAPGTKLFAWYPVDTNHRPGIQWVPVDTVHSVSSLCNIIYNFSI